jgi:hypothetical protein
MPLGVVNGITKWVRSGMVLLSLCDRDIGSQHPKNKKGMVTGGSLVVPEGCSMVPARAAGPNVFECSDSTF